MAEVSPPPQRPDTDFCDSMSRKWQASRLLPVICSCLKQGMCLKLFSCCCHTTQKEYLRQRAAVLEELQRAKVQAEEDRRKLLRRINRQFGTSRYK